MDILMKRNIQYLDFLFEQIQLMLMFQNHLILHMYKNPRSIL
jgi:hypothetical protein